MFKQSQEMAAVQLEVISKRPKSRSKILVEGRDQLTTKLQRKLVCFISLNNMYFV